MNKIVFAGQIENEPIFSHEVFGEKFYKFYVNSKRKSGIYDVAVCIVSEVIAGLIRQNEYIEVEGSVRTRNVNLEGKRKLEIAIFVDNIYEYEYDKNHVEIDGYICKPPVFRETPFGRQITDLLIASNRKYGKSDYVPAIVWGRNAIRVSDYPVGSYAMITGRLQSREYEKALENGERIKNTTYELSVATIELKEGEQCGN